MEENLFFLTPTFKTPNIIKIIYRKYISVQEVRVFLPHN